jgi:hypothetical protein
MQKQRYAQALLSAFEIAAIRQAAPTDLFFHQALWDSEYFDFFRPYLLSEILVKNYSGSSEL